MKHQGGSAARRPRILVDPGTYMCGNLGDVAMMEVAVSRLAHRLPEAHITVLTRNPAALGMHCPAASPLAVVGRQEWQAEHPVLGGIGRALPLRVRATAGNAQRLLRRVSPPTALRLIEFRLLVRGRRMAALRGYLETLREADLVLVCGQGSITDSHARHARHVLDMLESATKTGARVAMVGQGIGPLGQTALRIQAERVLPMLDMIAVREARTSIPLLRSLGVPAARIVLTGDDAIELAYQHRASALGHSLGLNLRLADYAGIERATLGRLAPALAAAIGTIDAPVVPVPIKVSGGLTDCDAVSDLLASAGIRHADLGEPSAPLDVIRRLQACRIVVTGAYHAAVLALAQGIPAVCLHNSDYYSAKFHGLADQFSEGCLVLSLTEALRPGVLAEAVCRSWEEAAAVRKGLLEAAQRQTAAGREAYDLLATLTRNAADMPEEKRPRT